MLMGWIPVRVAGFDLYECLTAVLMYLYLDGTRCSQDNSA